MEVVLTNYFVINSTSRVDIVQELFTLISETIHWIIIYQSQQMKGVLKADKNRKNKKNTQNKDVIWWAPTIEQAHVNTIHT